MIRATTIGLAAIALAACSANDYTGAISSQAVQITSDPTGASCDVQRGGDPLGAVQSTPSTVDVPVSSRAFTVTCTAAGYEPATVTVEPDIGAAEVGQSFADDVLTVLTDAGTLLFNGYPESVNVTLTPSAPTGGGDDMMDESMDDADGQMTDEAMES
jgi:hypothetical protein